ncbi:MAG: hypothetical protein LH645_03865 [Actinomycetia bacterium]|nr:hypothetical protein [Actinomycetes bacterium]
MDALDGVIARLRAGFDEPLAERGVRFSLRATTRLAAGGVRRVLLLQVMPVDGFDTFDWAASERSWIGRSRKLMAPESIEEQVSAILARYLDGEIPPFE